MRVDGTVLCLVLVATLGCSRRERDEAPSLDVSPPASARREAFSSASFATMLRLATALRAPSSADARLRIVTYLEIPEGSPIDTTGDTLADLRLPSDAVASRVEYWAPEGTPVDAAPAESWRILDIRSTRFAGDGELYSVARPDARGGHVQVAWPKAAHDRGTVALVTLAKSGALGGESAAERARMANKLAAINDCPSCHAPRAPEARTADALVQRGTDASGLYSLLSVFREEEPYETYRPRNLNDGDPLVGTRCTTGPVVAPRSPCTDGSRTRGHLDVERGVAARDPHVLQVCASRRALAARMTTTARALVARSLASCGSEGGPSPAPLAR